MSILNEFGFTDEIIVAIGYLHDTIEDTFVTEAEITDIFGVAISQGVSFCTDELWHNRKTRKNLTYDKCRKAHDEMAPMAHIGSVVKIADRLANIRNSVSGNYGLLQMYKNERDVFKKAMYVEHIASKMWTEYDHLLCDS